jgi:YVTN family beta-propeller protein
VHGDGGTVSELDASTGSVIQTITVGSNFPFGGPGGVSSDGTHVWVINGGNRTVSELNASTGSVIQTITVGRGPADVSSDGTHVWVPNASDNTVSEIAVTPTTSVIIPSNGATLSGTAATLDATASNATSVEFWLFGGSYGYTGHLIGTATPTYYGWLYIWNTTTVPNGSYALLSEAFGPGGSAFSSHVSITVNNAPPPTTSVIIPSNGATLSGTAATLDAIASNATSVEFVLFGGGYWDHVIGTATPTYYGWLYSWNTKTVANGSYVLFSEAFNSGGSAFSPGVNITVTN